MSEPLIALQGIAPRELARAIPGMNEAEARKLVSAIHRDRPLAPMSGVRRDVFRDALARTHVPALEQVADVGSTLDPFRKLAFRIETGEIFEAVRIPLERASRFSVCVSSQVGCALACSFCATGRLGLRRNLEAWEIVEQVRAIKRTLDPSRGERVHGVVFQGMGEPMANLDRVLTAISVMSEPSALAIDARNITVCTSGLPSGIRRLAAEAPKVRLAVSIAAAIATKRKLLMPIERTHSLDQVLEAASDWSIATGLAPMFAVTLLEGVNDTEDDASALAARIHAFFERSGKRPRLSIVPYNAIAEAPGPGLAGDTPDPYRRASQAREDRFRDALRSAGVYAHKRYSGGGDVGAACGQLAGRLALSPLGDPRLEELDVFGRQGG